MVQICPSICDGEFENYLFAGSNKVTVLTDYPDATTQEANTFESKKAGLFSRIKDVILEAISSYQAEGMPPEVQFEEGTYSCSGGSCVREPYDGTINYEKIKTVIPDILLCWVL